MKKISIILLITLVFCTVNNLFSQHDTIVEHDFNAKIEVSKHDASTITDAHVNEEHADNEHEGGMNPLFFIIIALLIGTATRHFLRKTPLPYTVLLLIFGLGLGVLTRLGVLHGGGLETLGSSIQWAGHIDPHLILFVFLPTLIFEAAFAMDLHTFKKTLTNALLLAVPGIIIALVMTGALVVAINVFGIGLNGWTWSIALMFGSVASATDPVAVVSLLKELGASKKLGTLIEGESLLNDGTAIVFFMVFFLGLTGHATDNFPVIEFGRVALGGTLLGVIIASITITWVKRVFNDALVEISLVVIGAYMTFFVAEHFLHVSGVLGLVALGLAMAGVGRTRISPQVEHFLHEFWELAAFIANTLIFVIVGVVIAQRIEFTAIDFLILGIVYVGIHVVRAVVILVLYPFMRKIGYGLKPSEGYVLWWGALRGAIGLALALMVANIDDKYISPEIKNTFLFLIAGIVTLTLMVNATTIKWLVSKLKLNTIPAAKKLMRIQANQYLLQSTENSIEKLKTDRFMSRANWTAVKKYLPKEILEENLDNLNVETIAETRRRVLEKEKSSYWHQFKDGLLGPVAVRRLSDGIDEILDAGGMVSLAQRKDLEEMWATPKLLIKIQSLPILGGIVERVMIDRLSVSYDSAKGFIVAQEEAIKLVESMYRGLQEGDKDTEDCLAVIEEEINENKIQGLTFMRNLRKNYPDIFSALSTRQAIRTLLNYERRTIERLQKNGRIDSGEASKMKSDIEERMKRLLYKPLSDEVPENEVIFREIKWLKNLEPDLFKKIVEKFQARVYSTGEELMRQNDPGDSMCVIAQGTVKVIVNEDVVAILGCGSVIGEMSVLNGMPRTATVVAETPVTALRIKILKIHRFIVESKELEQGIWEIAGTRFAENMLRKLEPFSIWRFKAFKKWLETGEIRNFNSKDELNLDKKVGVLLLGQVSDGQNLLSAPAVFINKNIKFISDGRIYVNDNEE